VRKTPKRLPTVLTKEEVHRVLDAMSGACLKTPLQEHLKRVKMMHEDDVANGYGHVYLPYALERKYAAIISMRAACEGL